MKIQDKKPGTNRAFVRLTASNGLDLKGAEFQG
jgi:hypothetical protein